MTTNATIIGDALREINVIDENQSASTEQGTLGLRILNRMLEAWTEDDIELGYFAQDDTTDTCPIPAWAERGVICRLAMAMASHYGATVSPELAFEANDSYGMILRKSIVEKIRPANMNHLPYGTGQLGDGATRYDIDSDTDNAGDEIWI